MKIKTYDGGHYLKACNSITYWAINDNIFIELNSQGLKYLVYNNLHNFHEDKPIFEICFEPETYFPSTDNQNFLEEERINNEIEKFLIDYVTHGRPNETN
jgi:hypothetical protein